jgi:hypothetical protein
MTTTLSGHNAETVSERERQEPPARASHAVASRASSSVESCGKRLPSASIQRLARIGGAARSATRVAAWSA